MTNSDQQYSTMTKEKKDKMTNSDQQYSTMGKGKKGQNRETVISNTAQWPKEQKDKIDKQ
jgi:hypothetical protein